MNYLDGLNDPQREAVEHGLGPVLVLAGAGSGKTRVLVSRVAHLIRTTGIAPWQILALTFTNKAAAEMKSRLHAMVGSEGTSIEAGTFHSIFARIMRREGQNIGIDPGYTIFDSADRRSLIKAILKEMNIPTDVMRPADADWTIGKQKQAFISPDEYSEMATYANQKIAAQVYHTYEKRLRRMNGMDFDDLLGRPLKAYKEYPEFLERLSRRYQYVLVDEFQDTNKVQYQLVKKLAEGHRNLFVVGDDDQSIYGWRGAHIENILKFANDWQDSKVIRLEQNYRSVQAILDVAHAVVSNNASRTPKKLWTERASNEKVVLIEAASDEEEAQKFISRISHEHLSNKTAYSQFAILYRTNSQSLAFERALRAAHIPYQVVGGLRFYERKEIKDILAYLRALANPADDVSLLRILNYPPRGIGQNTIDAINALTRSDSISANQALSEILTSELTTPRARKAIVNFVDMMRSFNELRQSSNNFLGLVRDIVERTGLKERLEQESKDDHAQADLKIANLNNFMEEIGRFCELNPDGKLEDYLTEVSLVSDIDELEEEVDKVNLMTIHSSKGLEFPVVFIGGLEENLLPLKPYNENETMNVEEERRLFYVAATRAMEKLTLGYAIDRLRWGNNFWSGPSRFIAEIPEEMLDVQYSYNSRLRQRQSSPKPRTKHGTGSLFDGPVSPSSRPEPSNGKALTRDHLHKGLLVQHPKFGLGIVLKFKGSGSDTYIDVDFDDVGEEDSATEVVQAGSCQVTLPKISCLTLMFLVMIAGLFTHAIASKGTDEYLYAQKLFDEGYYDLAAEQFERVLRDYPSEIDADRAQFQLAECYFRTENYEKARAAFLRTAISYDNSPLAPEAMYKVGITLDSLGRVEESIKAHIRIQSFYPGDRFALKGMHTAVEIAMRVGNHAAAEEIINQMIELYPDAESVIPLRMQKAMIFIARGDSAMAERYFLYVLTRSAIDTVAAEAGYQLGNLYKTRGDFYAAIDQFQVVIREFGHTLQAQLSKIKLAEIYNILGLNLEAIKLLKPLLEIDSESISNFASERIGDSYFLQNDIPTARSHYNLAGSSIPSTQLKSGWCSELLGDTEMAVQMYSTLTELPDIGKNAKIRLAILYAKVAAADNAARWWKELATKETDNSLKQRFWFEYLTISIDAGKKPEVSEWIRTNQIRSQWSDDIAHIIFQTDMITASMDQKQSLPVVRDYFSRFPASPYREIAQRNFEYVLLVERQSPNLMNKMAELYARPPGSVSDAQWSLDWGYFYLNELKDQHKALDNFTKTLDNYLASPGQIDSAITGRIEAYYKLLLKADREQDPFEVGMYADSVFSNIQNLLQTTQDSTNAYLHYNTFLKTLSSISGRYSTEIIDRVSEYTALVLQPSLVNVFPPDLLTLYINQSIDSEQAHQALLIHLRKHALDVSTEENSPTDLAKLKHAIWRIDIALSDSNIVDTAHKLVEDYPDTEVAVDVLEWLTTSSDLSAEDKLEYVSTLKEQYYYAIDLESLLYHEAMLLDSLGLVLAGFRTRSAADSISNIFTPDIDILNIPTPQKYYSHGRTLLMAGENESALESLIRSINFGLDFDFAPEALHSIATAYARLNKFHDADSTLDMLLKHYPYSIPSMTSNHLRSRIKMQLEDYEESLRLWSGLASHDTIPDSLFHYNVQSIVCLYRLGRLDEARKTAKLLYKTFADIPDIDSYKALFYLEKGNFYLQAGQFDEALEQYAAIKKSYTSSIYVDEAEFSTGMALIESGDLKNGLQTLEDCAENYPDSTVAIEGLMEVTKHYYKNGSYSEASIALQKIWNNPAAQYKWSEAFKWLIKVYNDLRFYDAAIRVTRDYLERFPNADDKLQRRMYLGWANLQLGDYDRAIHHYEPLLPQPDPEIEAEIQYYIGEAYMGKGDYRTAILEFLKVKILGRKTKLDWSVTALYQAGICHEKLGEIENAARMYQRIVRERGEADNFGRAALQKLKELK